MTVTELRPCTKTKYKVYLDGKFSFVLYKGELSRFGICEGAELSKDVTEKIRSEVLLKRAKLRALHLLADMDRTEASLREKLLQGFCPPDIAEEAIEYVRSFGYLDDTRFAENFVQSRQGTKSRQEIRAALLKKGVSEEAADRALEVRYDEREEAEAIRKLLRKKRFDPSCSQDRERQKIYGYLARKGFRYDLIRQVIQNYEDDA